MGKDHEGDIKQYNHTKEAWYAESAIRNGRYVDEVLFGFYSPYGGTSGEMGMRWYVQENQPTPRLEVFSDAWHTLWQFKDMLEKLAALDDTDITPQEFMSLLNECGFVDNTPRRYEDSYPEKH